MWIAALVLASCPVQPDTDAAQRQMSSLGDGVTRAVEHTEDDWPFADRGMNAAGITRQKRSKCEPAALDGLKDRAFSDTEMTQLAEVMKQYEPLLRGKTMRPFPTLHRLDGDNLLPPNWMFTACHGAAASATTFHHPIVGGQPPTSDIVFGDPMQYEWDENEFRKRAAHELFHGYFTHWDPRTDTVYPDGRDNPLVEDFRGAIANSKAGNAADDHPLKNTWEDMAESAARYHHDPDFRTSHPARWQFMDTLFKSGPHLTN